MKLANTQLKKLNKELTDKIEILSLWYICVKLLLTCNSGYN